ncbi:MAG TPA: Clp protease N-terminal domain-containing protein [Streptosporangiaceae bacterium]|nr:Clp protease N-terminal domain-containing protein [Streptosporangiaceae bacterium]
MSIPDAADLIVIAARVLGIDTRDALGLIDLPAAEAALAEARNRHGEPAGQVAAALLTGLIRHRPLPQGNRQVALLATLQFLGQQRLGLDLQPATAARDLIAGISSGTLAESAVTAWIAVRLRPRPGKEARIMKRLIRRGNCEPPAVTARTGKFPHFTDRAYRAVTLAEAEALGLRHNYVGTEHLLLGLLGIDDGVAAKVLTRLGVSAPEARSEIEQIIGRGSAPPTGQPRFTPRSKKVLALAHGEAKRLGHNYVGTEHLLLGLVREGEGLAAQILGRLGADRAGIVEALLHVLSDADPACREQRRASLTGELTAVLDENDRLHAEVERLRLLLRQHGVEPDDGAARSA